MSSQINIPSEVQAAYFDGGQPTFEQITAGDLATATFRAEVDGARFIMQSLAPVFADPNLQRDFEVVTDHLAKEGWEVPRLVRTADGSRSMVDEDGQTWRTMTNIDCDPVSPAHPDGAKVGALLGRLHVDLAKLDYQPEFELPHFHDTAYYLHILKLKTPILETAEARSYGRNIVDAYEQIGTVGHADQTQLIHGDPRTANDLFRDGEPFTVIDFDTIMKGSIWLDVGDLLRSLAEDASKDGRDFTLAEMGEVVEAYRTIAYPEADPKEFQSTAVKAMQLISLELAARFLNDLDGDYFGTSPEFESHAESNMFRVRQQWEIYQLFNEKQVA